MKVGDPVAVIWDRYVGYGAALMRAKVVSLSSTADDEDYFLVVLEDAFDLADTVRYLLSAEGTAWCHDTPEAVDALKVAYALR